MSCEVLNKIGTGDCERNVHHKSDPNLAKIIATELVAEIIENALDIVEDSDERKSTTVVGDILDSLTKKFDKEMEMMEDSAKFDDKEECCSLPLKGLGDQLNADKEIIRVETSVRHPPVEKRNRLTDLVKNSKHILAKLILNESKEALAAKNEEVIRVVELDSGDQPFKIDRKILPENIPLPRDDSKEILEEDQAENEKMDEIELVEPNDNEGGKGEEVHKKTMTFPMDGRSGKAMGLAARCRTLKFPQELKKKKWNIGSKLINYIRKHHKKEDKEKEAGGVVLQPKVDNE
ncbi:hypothetical protein NQ318_000424 [Aromia moschata]|uniref:Uncharacterized protein n=1 Tax=Aromia moschata TaxID=1265417 RepID=A0AAV8YTL7_9CUCU|nr:hypothetical protein NQ318_000424 [Aromia moschata]